MTPRALRIALYSHDTMGLGHMRRNLLLAEELAASSARPSVLVIAGSREVARFGVPRGVDVLSLPALYKDSAARYHARSLEVSLPELIAIRSSIIAVAIEAFAPDVFIVDNVPRGAVGELEPVLERLRRQRRVRCVLGLRDILDDAAHVRKEWARAANIPAVRRYYDAIWVYGDQTVADVAAEYGFPEDIRRRIQYTGYLDQTRRAGSDQTHGSDEGQLVVPCLLGGGQDGLRVATAFVAAELPSQFRSLLVTGPMMSDASRRELQQVAARHPRVEVVDFVDDPAALMRRSHAVITMGGYNTVCDVLSHDVRALVVPRVRPRTEQLIRANRLAERGLLDVMHPDVLSPQALSDWVCEPAPPRTKRPVRMHTGPGLVGLLDDVLAGHGHAEPDIAPHEVALHAS